jgi:hypothetical protein
MKQIILFCIIFISNLGFSQNDSIPSVNDIYNRRFDLSEPLVLPDYPIFKGLELNAIWECLITLDIFQKIKEDIDFTNERNQIYKRLREMSTILKKEGIYLYLTNGLDCSDVSRERNQKFNETKELYLCIGDCTTVVGYAEGMEVFNKATRENQIIKK